MISLGEYNTLKILRNTGVGLYLGTEEEAVLLPKRYVPENYEIGEEITVFVYGDSEHRPVATTLVPTIVLGQFACLEAKSVGKFGAFMDWGIAKDLLVPFSEQKREIREGSQHIIYLYKDEKTNRLTGSAKIDKFIEKENIELEVGEEVDLLIGKPTELGFNVIVNDKYKALLYHNEIFADIDLGDQVPGFVKNIRADKKIDVTLQQQGVENIEPNAEKILYRLKANDGFLKLTDKSDPNEIYFELEMSKKTFKKAIGSLYKQKIVRLEEDGVYLNKD